MFALEFDEFLPQHQQLAVLAMLCVLVLLGIVAQPTYLRLRLLEVPLHQPEMLGLCFFSLQLPQLGFGGPGDVVVLALHQLQLLLAMGGVVLELVQLRLQIIVHFLLLLDLTIG